MNPSEHAQEAMGEILSTACVNELFSFAPGWLAISKSFPPLTAAHPAHTP